MTSACGMSSTRRGRHHAALRKVDTLLLSLEFESVRRSTVEFTKLVAKRLRR